MKSACFAALLLLFAVPAAEGASADKRTFPAKGTKTCRITQYAGKYLADHGNPHQRTLPRPNVNRDGSVDMGLAEDTYPGTKVYYLINGRRYVGSAGYMTSIDKTGVEALKKDPVIQFTYTRWPYRSEINGADVIEDFAVAYNDCLYFLKSK